MIVEMRDSIGDFLVAVCVRTLKKEREFHAEDESALFLPFVLKMKSSVKKSPYSGLKLD